MQSGPEHIRITAKLARKAVDELLRAIAYDAKIEGNDGDLNDWRIDTAKAADVELARIQESLSDDA